MTELITIDRRFCGPAGSGNGGYTCGLTAQALTEGTAQVTLRRPPPLDRPLRIDRHDGTVALCDGDEVIAEARHAELDVAVPAPVDVDTARRAAARFDVDAYAAAHSFPTCYTCGPARAEGDGLRLFPAPIDDREGLVAWPWTPDESLADDQGLVSVPTMWASLDCPSGLAWITSPADPGPAVLGRMTAAVHRRPAPGEQLVAGGWPIAVEGRKLLSGSAVWGDDGEVLAANQATWILLSGEQQSAFGVAGTGR